MFEPVKLSENLTSLAKSMTAGGPNPLRPQPILSRGMTIALWISSYYSMVFHETSLQFVRHQRCAVF